MFIAENKILLKKEKVYDFIINCHKFGFVNGSDNSYECKKVLSETNEELFILFTVSIDSLDVYIELNVPSPYWIELGLETFEPLFQLYKEGYFEIT